MARRSSILHFFISRNIIERFSVGCDKVNCGNAAREGALGYDLGAPYGRAYAIPKTFRNNGNDSIITKTQTHDFKVCVLFYLECRNEK